MEEFTKLVDGTSPQFSYKVLTMKINQILSHTEWGRADGIPPKNQLMWFDGTIMAKSIGTSNTDQDVILRGNHYFHSYVVGNAFVPDYNPAHRTDWSWICVTSMMDEGVYPRLDTRYFIERIEWDRKRKGKTNENLTVIYKAEGRPHKVNVGQV